MPSQRSGYNAYVTTQIFLLHRILHLSTPRLVPVLLLLLAALALEAHAPFHPLFALHVPQSTQRSGKGKGFF